MILSFGSKPKLYEITYNMCPRYDFCLNISPNQMKYHFTPIRMAIIFEKNGKQQVLAGCGKNGTPVCAGATVKW